MATTTRMSAPRLWMQALYTIPQVDLSLVAPVPGGLVRERVSVVGRTATSAVSGGLLAARDSVFDWPLFVLTLAGLVLAHTASNLVNDFWDYRRGPDSPDSPPPTYGPPPLTAESGARPPSRPATPPPPMGWHRNPNTHPSPGAPPPAVQFVWPNR